ncbi:hypothetical protein FOMPIDRAFT_82783 [Fomitopsis schrenkii]|uniref:Uncharacterized protein n=1 Tax=Fomitopsis schrenkii TaxID=2126942 RepID=S8G3F0_FOMSC|nr:hypothetical protein FOMPIDRAFT_82783 [Fomitopsis schrenkii]
MSYFMPYTLHGSNRTRGTTAIDLLNAIRDGSWRSKPREPQYIAAPVPSRARASYADILDNEWELWRGGVRLVSTKQEAVQRECLDEDSPYATWPPPRSFIRNASYAPSSELGLGMGVTGLGSERLSIVEGCSNERVQCDCYAHGTSEQRQDQSEDQTAEVARLLDELLELQRQRRAQEKKDRLLAHAWSVPFRGPQAFDGAEPGLNDETTATTRSVWGRAGNVRYDGTDPPVNSSSRPLSFSTSSTTTTNTMLPSVEYMYIPAPGASPDYSQGRVNARAYDADPKRLPYTDSIAPPTSSSTSSLPKILARGFSFFETAPKKPAEKISWGNRVGRRIRGCGRQIMGHA